MVTKDGTKFQVSSGAVVGFVSPGSFYEGEMINARTIDRYKGPLTLAPEEATRLGTRIMQRLVKSGDPLARAQIRIQRPSSGDIPFYRIEWLDTGYHLVSMAKLEIDGRTGRIVDLHLWDQGFRDWARDKDTRDRVYRPEPVPPAPPVRRNLSVVPYPPTNQVPALIQSWIAFCRRFDLEPGQNTNVAQIDWDKSLVYTDRLLTASAPVCRIVFTNGAILESIEGVVFSHFGADGFFVGDYTKRRRSEWTAIQGQGARKWEELAAAFGARVFQQLGLPKETAESLRPSTIGGAAVALERVPLKRVVVVWRKGWEPSLLVSEEAFPRQFTAEFDLETGATKWLSFRDNPTLLGWRKH
jgi:hypothetical protein